MDNERIVSLIQAGKDPKGNTEKLYRLNTGLIGLCLRPYKARRDIDDLEQEAYIAFHEAIYHYDPDKGASFSSYAVHCIRWRLYRVSFTDRALQIPESLLSDIIKYEALTRSNGGNRPADTLACNALGISEKRLKRILKTIDTLNVLSLSSPVSNLSDTTLVDTIPDSRNDIEALEDQIDRERLSLTLWESVDRLKEDQESIIRLIYADGVTLKEAGTRLNMPYNTAADLKAKALRRLRSEKRLRDLYTATNTGLYYRGGLRKFLRSGESVTEYAAIRQASVQGY